MSDKETYTRYPLSVVLLCNLVSLAIYGLGIYLLAGFGWLVALAYLLLVLWLELRLLRKACVDCAYYGQLCAFGKGALCARLFGRGDPARFVQRAASWRDVLPDLLVSILPLLGGLVRLVRDFSWVVLGVMLILLVLSTAGNGLVRGKLACKHCRQRELGCPAAALLGGSKL